MLNPESEFNTPYEVPDWAIPHLGQLVRFVVEHDEYGDGTFVNKPGTIGFLDAIQYSQNGPVAIVELCNRGESLVDVPFFKLQRDVDFFLSIPGRAGEFALAWKEGSDLKTRVSRTTYYRLRKELLSYGVDITKPYDFESLPLPA